MKFVIFFTGRKWHCPLRLSIQVLPSRVIRASAVIGCRSDCAECYCSHVYLLFPKKFSHLRPQPPPDIGVFFASWTLHWKWKLIPQNSYFLQEMVENFLRHNKSDTFLRVLKPHFRMDFYHKYCANAFSHQDHGLLYMILYFYNQNDLTI